MFNKMQFDLTFCSNFSRDMQKNNAQKHFAIMRFNLKRNRQKHTIESGMIYEFAKTSVLKIHIIITLRYKY